MASVKSNITTNLFSAVWITVLTAVITPLQVNFLGIESYGLIGLIATLQIVFSAFDLGLSSTLTREIAADPSPGHLGSSELIRTASTVYWTLAMIIALVLGVSAGLIAQHWFNAQTMASSNVEAALYLIIFYLALRWPIALYTGILAGLRRFDVVNIVKIATATLRNVSGILVIYIWRDVHVFLWCLAANALIEVLIYFLASKRAFRVASFGFGISIPALRAVWKFSLNMGAISILALIVSQLDRLVASKLLSLEQFGYYSLAYNTAAVATIATAAVSSAMLPSFAALHALTDKAVIVRHYLAASRVILFVMGLATFPLIFFGSAILDLWIGPVAASNAYPAMAILALAFWFSAAFSNPYSVAVAMGRPDIPLKVSVFGAVPYLLLLVFMLRHWGGPGGAAAWLALMLFYIACLVPVVHHRMLGISVSGWLGKTLLPFGLLGCGAFGVPLLLIHTSPDFDPRYATTVFGLAAGIMLYTTFGYWLLGADIRAQILGLVTSIRGSGDQRAKPT